MMDLFIPNFCGMGLHLRLDGFRMVYCLIAVFMWAVSSAFSREYMAHYENRGRYYFFLWAGSGDVSGRGGYRRAGAADGPVPPL